VLVQRVHVCLPIVVAIGLVSVAPASAQELVDVAALEAQVEAAAELTELPAGSDWGVPDPSNSLPAVPQGAPEVPSAPTEVGEPAPEPRYQVERPRYHPEYQVPEADPAPPPVAAAAPAAPSQEPVQEPTMPAPTQAPAQPAEVPAAPQTPSTPTVWIWVWNWTWVQGTDERYRNSEDQYQISPSLVDKNLTRIIEKIGIQMPVQIGVQTGDDIVSDIVKDIAPEGMQLPSAPIAHPTYRAPVELEKTEPVERRPPARAPGALVRPYGAPLDAGTAAPRVLTSPRAAPAPQQASRSGKLPRIRRASRPPARPLPAEQVGDSASASGVSAGIFLKNFAVLIASLLLAVLGRGRRLRLPSIRWRGLLGTRTDPPG
jgi:hypothetical protein